MQVRLHKTILKRFVIDKHGGILTERGNLGTVDLLVEVTKLNNTFNINMSSSKLVSTRRSTVLSLSFQLGFPANPLAYFAEPLVTEKKKSFLRLTPGRLCSIASFQFTMKKMFVN